ncbi:MAG: hypothetical protein EBZ41_05030 [Actinobacteria bacterium]|nr:hypothetical protein [Actinomycetota bacterium]
MAAVETATISASQDGKNLSKNSLIPGERNIKPAVARTERIKPGSCPWKGSKRSKTITALDSAAAAFARLPVAIARRTTSAIIPARSTEGDGLTSSKNRKRTTPVVTILTTRFGITSLRRKKTSALTMAKFAPLTAVKWARPDLRICLVNSWLCSEVSPNIIPGISAAELLWYFAA